MTKKPITEKKFKDTLRGLLFDGCQKIDYHGEYKKRTKHYLEMEDVISIITGIFYKYQSKDAEVHKGLAKKQKKTTKGGS